MLDAVEGGNQKINDKNFFFKFWCGIREFFKSNLDCLKGHSHSGFLDLFLYRPYHITAYIFVLPHPEKRHPRLTVFHFLIFFHQKKSERNDKLLESPRIELFE